MRISAKGQVTIPKHVRDRAGLHEGTDVDFVFDGDVVTLKRTEPGQRGKSLGQRMVEALRGTATVNRDLSTDEIMRLLRGETYAEEFGRTAAGGFAEAKPSGISATMTDTLIDTNILLDVLADDGRWTEWSGREMANAIDEGSIVLSPVVYAELAAGYDQHEALDEALFPWPIRRENLPWDAAFMAGRAFLSYRRSGGTRPSPLPDFFIGAHAAVRGYRLLTRDRGYYTRFFPTVKIISPEAGP